ncbi:MAG: photosystem I reaction center subunit XI [Xenococcaceae cyanobacterium]|nr:photosystem I reaction center subunit XI [Xenococcaceae cyanobacterium MO_188.B29]
MDAIQPGKDPQVGNLATPLNSSDVTATFIRNLPAYRPGLSGFRRGLEVGMAHGYFVYGPFLLLGPLRGSDVAELAGLLASVGLVAILTVALSLYGSYMGGAPSSTVTTPDIPETFTTKEGWSEFASGFLVGGCSAAFFAYFICSTARLGPLQDLVNSILS